MEIFKLNQPSGSQAATPLKNHANKVPNNPHASTGKDDTLNISSDARVAQLFNTFVNQLEQLGTRDSNSETKELEGNSSVENNHSSVWKMGDHALGEMFFGKALLDEWANKGLQINEDTIQKAGQVFNEAFRAYINDPNKDHIGPSFDRHKLVADNQEVPDWFNDEHRQWLSHMSSDTIKAFNTGSYYHLSSKSS